MKAMLLALVLASSAAQAEVKFDQKLADARRSVVPLVLQTRVCFEDTASMLLRTGIRDTETIMGFMVEFCAGPLAYHLGKPPLSTSDEQIKELILRDVVIAFSRVSSRGQ